jgi:hypothetical protein
LVPAGRAFLSLRWPPLGAGGISQPFVATNSPFVIEKNANIN